ncbi:MAG TPA: hypothetical protein VD978_05005 [Azospirillum sp.]|nr:hypothetical protein [Azospirillum sp.]
MVERLIAAVRRPQPAGGIALWLMLAAPPVRTAAEADMSLHMLVQIPLLMVAGWLLAGALRPPAWFRLADEGGWAGTLVAVLAASYWMVPRVLDAALVDLRFEFLKFVGLPLLVGAPLRWSWPRLSALGRGFVITNMLSMTAFVGWLYVAAPVRVCVYYMAEQQVMAGKLLLAATAAAGLLFFLRCLVGPAERISATRVSTNLGET